MDSSGRIHQLTAKDVAALRRQLGELVPAAEADMTAKQRRTRRVSLHDTRSTLGRRLHKLRNKPCPCGSGKKYKKCCALGARP